MKHIRFDWAMKRLLRNKANFEVLEGFLSELLKFDVKIKEILESESNQEDEDDKYNRVDMLVKDEKEELILIEVQNSSESDYFHRMNYGQAKLITEYLDLGQKYGEIKKIYSINIVYFGLGQGDDYVYIGRTNFEGMHKKDRLQLTRKQKEVFQIQEVSDIFTTYYILRINNFDDIAKDSLDEWIYFLKHSEIKEEFQAKGMNKAKEVLKIDNLDKKQRLDFEKFIKDWRIKEAEIETAITEAIDKAKQKYIPLIEQERKEKEEAKRKAEEAKEKAEQERKEKEEAKRKAEEAKEKAEQERKEKEEAKRKAEEAKQKAEQERKEKEEAKRKAEEAKEKAEQERKEKEEAKQKLYKSAKALKLSGMNIKEISDITGLSIDEIENL